MKYSNQIWFCNACGQMQNSSPCNALGREYRCCSADCVKEMQWKYVLSLMNETYKPRKKEKDEE